MLKKLKRMEEFEETYKQGVLVGKIQALKYVLGYIEDM